MVVHCSMGRIPKWFYELTQIPANVTSYSPVACFALEASIQRAWKQLQQKEKGKWAEMSM